MSLRSERVRRPSGAGSVQMRWRVKCDSGEVCWNRQRDAKSLNLLVIFFFNDTETPEIYTDGLVIGAGAEWAVWNNIVVGAEYLHYAFGDDKVLPSTPVIGPWGAGGDHINLKTVDVVRLRASYLFNWGGGGHY